MHQIILLNEIKKQKKRVKKTSRQKVKLSTQKSIKQYLYDSILTEVCLRTVTVYVFRYKCNNIYLNHKPTRQPKTKTKLNENYKQ